MNEKKVAFVIGGTGGIGFECVKSLLNQNMKICFTYCNNKEKAQDFLISLKTEDVEMYCVDLTKEETIVRAIKEVIERNKKIDVVIHCATIPVTYKKIQNLEWNDFQRHIDVQTKGMLSIIKLLFPLIRKGHTIKFIVILTESCTGKPPNCLSHYVTAKYSLMGFSKSMAVELARYHCTFNMISPGMTKTGLISNFPPKLIEITASNNPMKRIAEPKDVANVVVFLASQDSDYLNGVNIAVNGGG